MAVICFAGLSGASFAVASACNEVKNVHIRALLIGFGTFLALATICISMQDVAFMIVRLLH